ncbi:Response regulator MprA [bioreactor metagenome]|uniref:Response regulator MprA n=1 Tax=bioreactor metagenome TaxID=1076179 RepID=A0A644WMX4_9ZZZZ
MTFSKNIMIIDDDVYIGNMLEEALAKEGYGVSRAYSGTEALLLLSNHRPELILLDLMLPGLSGEEVLPKLAGIPVIVVSAKVDVSDKVELLMGGAADYIAKPFDMKELLARVAVQLRNASVMGTASVLTFEDLVMDVSAHGVSANGIPAKLTKTEYAILKQLMQSPSQVVTKSRLLDLISLDTPDCMESSLKVHVSNLRKKLREAGDKDYIEAVWGIGFKLHEE